MEKIRYSKYKSVEVTKSLKSDDVKSPKGESLNNEPPNNSAENTAPAIPANHQVQPQSIPSAPPLEDENYPEFDEKAALLIQKASKHAKFANSALLYSDVKTAIVNLENALALLKTLD